MFKKTFFICFALLVLVLSSCKNDLELNAPYKEIPTVYAVLNPQDKEQVIKINKVFLGEGDANEMAKIADSVNYAEGELTVTLQRFINDAPVSASPDAQVIVFTERMSTVQPGAFSQVQRLYVTDKRLYTTGKYLLTIKNNNTGNVFTARANSLDSITGNQGFNPFNSNPSYPYPENTAIGSYIPYNATGSFNVRFTPDKFAKLYQLKIRTHFYDSSSIGKRYDFVDYDFSTREEKSKTISSNLTYISFDFRGVDYFTSVGLELAKKNLTDNIYGRKVYMVQYFVYSSTQEYIDFLQYTAPSFALTQNTPIYSNFDDKAAVGIFTFRTRSSVRKEPSSEMINEFSRNPNTCNYRFYDSKLILVGCQ